MRVQHIILIKARYYILPDGIKGAYEYINPPLPDLEEVIVYRVQ